MKGRSVQQSGRTLIDDFRLNLPVGTVSAEQSQAFVQSVRRVDDGFRFSTRIERAKP